MESTEVRRQDALGEANRHDIELLGAKKDKLVGKLVERYGILKDEAEKQVDEWTRKLDARNGDRPQK